MIVDADLVQRILNSHVSFARGGVSLNSTTASASAKPAITPTAWPYLGQPITVNLEPQTTFNDVVKACPGRRRLVKRTQSFAGMSLTMQFDEVQKAAFEWFYQANGSITADYVPLARTTPFEAWLKLQTYDESDNLIDVSDQWCHVQPDGGLSLGGDDNARFSIRATLLASTLNAGTLSTLTQ